MTTISSNLQTVHQRIAAACEAAGRVQQSVTLLAVSKTWPADAVREAAACGQHSFGENYVQEGLEKITALSGLGLEWHFIGPLQSNKTRAVAEHFSWVHTIDRLKIAERLSSQRPPHLPPLQVCIQVNVSDEASKSGVAPEHACELVLAVSKLPQLTVRGLMAIPEPTDDAARLQTQFATLTRLQLELQQAGLAMDTLSLGMSHDLEQAIAAGSTMVRIGTAIFGARPPAV